MLQHRITDTREQLNVVAAEYFQFTFPHCPAKPFVQRSSHPGLLLIVEHILGRRARKSYSTMALCMLLLARRRRAKKWSLYGLMPFGSVYRYMINELPLRLRLPVFDCYKLSIGADTKIRIKKYLITFSFGVFSSLHCMRAPLRAAELNKSAKKSTKCRALKSLKWYPPKFLKCR